LIGNDVRPATSTPYCSKAGLGYMIVLETNPNYVYWNNVTKLVERFEV